VIFDNARRLPVTSTFGDDVTLAPSPQSTSFSRIGDYAFLGGFTTAHQGLPCRS